jgi:GTP-binding protein
MSQREGQKVDEFARWLFAQECTFVAGADKMEILPPPDLPEIAFAGRSNVGKSSLINALLGRHSLARVSHTPGRTQQLNFFSWAKDLHCDMPGYGYAAVSKEKLSLVSTHSRLFERPSSLKRVFLLIDSRHGFKVTDEAVMEELDKAAVSYQIVLTKADKSPPEHLEALVLSFRALKKHPCLSDTSHTLARVRTQSLRETIADLVGGDPLPLKLIIHKSRTKRAQIYAQNGLPCFFFL